MLLSLLLTGFLYPRAPMPKAVRLVGDLIPLTYYVRIVRGVFTKGVGLAYIQRDVLTLGLYATVTMVVSAISFRKRLD